MGARLVVGAIAVMAVAGGCRKTDTGGAVPAAREPAESAAPVAKGGALDPSALVAQEKWRTEVRGAMPWAVAALPDGGAVAAWTFSETAAAGDTAYVSRGEGDVLLTFVDAAGAVTAGVQLGGEAHEFFEGLVVAGDRVYVGLRSTGPIALGETTLAPRDPNPEDVFDVPSLAAVAVLTAGGEVTGGLRLGNDLDGLAIGGIPGGEGDLIVGASYMGDESIFGRAVLRRIGADGEPRWEQVLDAVEIHRLQPIADGELAVSLRADDGLRVRVVNAKSGAPVREYGLAKLPGMGDLGSIEGVVQVAGIDHAFGETGAGVDVEGQAFQRPSYAIQPFVLAKPAERAAAFADLGDVTGMVTGTGAYRGAPAAVLRVIHTGREDKTVHRGEYLVLGAAPPALVPIFQYRYENDDWEHQPKEIVLGQELYSHDAAFAGDDVLIVGTCDENSGSGCVVRIGFATKEAAAK